MTQLAALPHVTLTAWQALVEVAKVAPGQSVLIHAAAGGVGHIAVQLSKIHGAKTNGKGCRAANRPGIPYFPCSDDPFIFC